MFKTYFYVQQIKNYNYTNKIDAASNYIETDYPKTKIFCHV